MKPARIVTLLSIAMAVAMALLTTSCENDHSVDGSEFYISPSDYTFLRTNDFVVSFGVHGAVLPVTWQLSDQNMGTISGARSGANTYTTVVNYTRTPGAVGVNTLVVYDDRGWRASARITVPARIVPQGEASPTTGKE